MRGSLFIGRYAGIDVFIHWTFSFLILWFVGSGVAKGMNAIQISWTIAFILSVFACVTLHEFGHALAARRFGIKTRHISLLLIGGVAQLESMPENPKQELIVALAGPIVNVFIVLLLIPFVYKGNFDAEGLYSITSGNFLINLLTVNIVLAVFNMIPAFPMDGGRVLRALLSFIFSRAKATNIAARLGQLLAIGFAILGLYFNPFLVLIGIFIFFGAQSENSMVQTQSVLKGYFVRDVLIKDFLELAPGDKLSDASKMLLNTQSTDFVVMDQGRFIGVLGRDELMQGISARGLDSTVFESMSRSFKILTPDLPLQDIYPTLKVKGTSILPVVEHGKLIGVVDNDNVLEFILLKESIRTGN